jgi:hypothetical protein
VSFLQIAALMRRHLGAVMVVIIVATTTVLIFNRTPVTYQESGTVIFKAPGFSFSPNPDTSSSKGVVVTAGIMALLLMSPRDQRQVKAAGGTAAYDVALVNLADLEYPDYGYPDVTVTATATDPAQVDRTFALVIRKLHSNLVSRQAQAGASRETRITASIAGDTGSQAKVGSSARVYAGLLVLAIIAAFAVAVILDRHRVGPNRLFRNAGSLRAGRAGASPMMRR